MKNFIDVRFLNEWRINYRYDINFDFIELK